MRWKIEFGGITDTSPAGSYVFKLSASINELNRVDYITNNIFGRLAEYEIDGVKLNEIVRLGSRFYLGNVEEVVQSFNIDASFKEKLNDIKNVLLAVIKDLNQEFEEKLNVLNQIENEGEV